MGEKYAIFAFNGEMMFFAHALLYVNEMSERGHDVKLIVDGVATKHIRELPGSSSPFTDLYLRTRDAGLIDCACRMCSKMTGSLESVEAQGIRLGDDMSGHPSVSEYIEAGYRVLVM